MLTTYEEIFRNYLRYEMTQDEYGFYDPEFYDVLKDKAVFFIGGFMNEVVGKLGLYFYDAGNLLTAHHIPWVYRGYPSTTAFTDNADILSKHLCEYSKRIQGRPIILVGHSMGGAEALYSVLTHHNLILDNIVEKVVLINAAIGGSVLAERLPYGVLGQGLQYFFGDGLESLTPAFSTQIFSDALENLKRFLPSEAFARMSGSVFYIRSATANPFSMDLWFATTFCDTSRFHGILNDGVIAVDAQLLRGFGIDLGILDGDHIQFVISGVVRSRSTWKHRRAFTRAFLKAIHAHFCLNPPV